MGGGALWFEEHDIPASWSLSKHNVDDILAGRSSMAPEEIARVIAFCARVSARHADAEARDAERLAEIEKWKRVAVFAMKRGLRATEPAGGMPGRVRWWSIIDGPTEHWVEYDGTDESLLDALARAAGEE